jgi:cation transport protein ChaC
MTKNDSFGQSLPMTVQPMGPLYDGPQTAAEHHARQTDADLWVFAYGSLMWRPGFEFMESRPAMVHGWHRALCILSVRYRGTPDRPGLVLGLDRGGSCRGWAYRVAAAQRPTVADYLDARELATRSYQPRFLSLRLQGGERVQAYGYVADPAHPQYGGALSQSEKVALIAGGHGQEGPCRDYLVNTIDQLNALGVHDRLLSRTLKAVDHFVR